MIPAAAATVAQEAVNVIAGMAAAIAQARKARRDKAEAITEIYGPIFIRSGYLQGLRVAAGTAGRSLRRANIPRGQVQKNVYVYFPEWRKVPSHLLPVLRAALDDMAKGNDSQALTAIVASNLFGLRG